MTVCALVFIFAPCAVSSVEELKSSYNRLEADVVAHSEAYTVGHPQDPWGWHYLGLARFEAGLYRRAEQALHEAARLDPERALHQLQLAHYYWRRGRPHAAFRHFGFAEAIERDPDRREALRKTKERAQAVLQDVERSSRRQQAVALTLLLVLATWPFRAVLIRLRK